MDRVGDRVQPRDGLHSTASSTRRLCGNPARARRWLDDQAAAGCLARNTRPHLLGRTRALILSTPHIMHPSKLPRPAARLLRIDPAASQTPAVDHAKLLSEREKALDQREVVLAERQQHLDKREAQLLQLEALLKRQQQQQQQQERLALLKRRQQVQQPPQPQQERRPRQRQHPATVKQPPARPPPAQKPVVQPRLPKPREPANSTKGKVHAKRPATKDVGRPSSEKAPAKADPDGGNEVDEKDDEEEEEAEAEEEEKEEEEGTENETDGDDEDESSDDEAEEEGDESDDDDDDDEEESDDDDEDEEDEASSASEEEESDQDDATANESVERATAVEEQAGNNDAVEEEEADGQEDHDEDQPIGDPPTSATKQREVEAIESEPHEQCDAVAALLACSEADDAGGKPAPRAKVHAAAEGGSGKKNVENAAVTKESKAMPMAQTFPMPCRERSGARRPITPRCEAAPWSVEHKDE